MKVFAAFVVCCVGGFAVSVSGYPANDASGNELDSQYLNNLLEDSRKTLNINTTGEDKTLNPGAYGPKVYTVEDIENEVGLADWEAPYNISRDYVYYLGGNDYENRPIWFAEAGKWDWRRIVEGGEPYIRGFEKYIRQLALRNLQSWRNRSMEDESVENCMAVVDLDKLSLAQVLSVDALAFFLRLNYQMRIMIARNFGYVMVINTNAVAATVINAVRPVLGEVFERIEVFGTNKARWQPELAKRIPRSDIPTWYGGDKDYKPIAVYG